MLRVYPKDGPLTFRPELKRLRAFPGHQYRCHIGRRLLKNMSRFLPPEVPPKFFMGLGATDDEGRYLPKPSEIKSYPTPGFWYKFGTYNPKETYYGIAKRAYGGAGKEVQAGLIRINDSSWNDHINRKEKGWTAYKSLLKKTGGKGLQSTPDYDSTNNPRAKVLTGHEYPVLWIPPVTGEEPEEMGFEDPVVTAPTPVPVVTAPTPVPETSPTVPTPIPGPPGPKGAKGDPGPPPSTSAIQTAVENYFVKNPPSTVTGPAGPKGDPGPPPSTSAIQTAVEDYLQINPPPPGPIGPPGPAGATGGTEGGKKLWALSLAALFATLK